MVNNRQYNHILGFYATIKISYSSSDNKDKPHKPKADFQRGKTQNTLSTHKTKVMMLSYTLLDSKL